MLYPNFKFQIDHMDTSTRKEKFEVKSGYEVLGSFEAVFENDLRQGFKECESEKWFLLISKDLLRCAIKWTVSVKPEIMWHHVITDH